MSKIHIIYPDIDTGYYPNINHGIAFLAGAVRTAGHEFSFDHLTRRESPDDTARRALATGSNIIGFSMCHNQRKWAKEIIGSLREGKCKALIIAGGIYPTTDPEEVFRYLDVDGAAIGESEITLPKLMNVIDNGATRVDELSGFYFRRTDGSIKKNNIPPLEADITKLPLPDYSVFDLGKIVKESGGWMTMLLMRGCPYNCYYCCNSILMNLYPVKKDYFRVPPVDYAIKLIKQNLGFVDGVRGIVFDDDLLCLRSDWFLEFARRYVDEIGLPYNINARAETLTDKVIVALKESGCRIVNIGVESGSPEVRENILNRNYTNELLISVFSKLNQAGILTSTFNMIGLPFETREQMRETLKINIKLKPYRGACFYFYPYPGTHLYDICIENNLLKPGYDKLTGYFKEPAIKMTRCREKDPVNICERLRLYLYTRRLLSSIGMGYLSNILYYAATPFAGVVSRLITGDSWLKSWVRRFVYRAAVLKREGEDKKLENCSRGLIFK